MPSKEAVEYHVLVYYQTNEQIYDTVFRKVTQTTYCTYDE